MEFEPITRVSVPALDDILGKPFTVLDKGFVRVVDYMGADEAIVQAARVSYGKGTKRVSEDRGLIRYLLRHRHTSPLEMCELKLHVKVPMDTWRQWIRHRMANTNEYSTRYSEAIDDKQKTGSYDWRSQSNSNRQGSGGAPVKYPNDGYPDVRDYLSSGDWLTQKENELHEHAAKVYRERLEFGVAREQARKDLPLSTYTEAYWKIDLHNLLHFLSLRMDSHAQKEIRDYANVIGNEIVSKWVPLVWEAFQDYRLGAASFSKQELDVLKSLAFERGEWPSQPDSISKREWDEFKKKLGLS